MFFSFMVSINSRVYCFIISLKVSNWMHLQTLTKLVVLFIGSVIWLQCQPQGKIEVSSGRARITFWITIYRVMSDNLYKVYTFFCHALCVPPFSGFYTKNERNFFLKYSTILTKIYFGNIFPFGVPLGTCRTSSWLEVSDFKIFNIVYLICIIWQVLTEFDIFLKCRSFQANSSSV